MRVHVDDNKCLGNGLCEETAGDVFDLGEKTSVHVTLNPVGEERRVEIEKAVEQCPVNALRIED